MSLLHFKKKKKSTSDVQGYTIRSLALLDDLGPDGGPAPILPAHAEPKRRGDDLLILGRNLPFAHDSISRSESIARCGTTPSDRISCGRRLLGGTRRPRGELCRKREMMPTRQGNDEKKKEARRSPKTTMHNVQLIFF
jgi:hypothetical protein